jgi:hypothetical protein
VSEFEHPPYGDHIAVPGPAEEIGSGPATWPAPGLSTDVLPAAGPDPSGRRNGRTIVAATLAVLLVLVVGGAAYGWSVLQRPDVRLARAFDATRSAPQGSLTLSITAAGKAAQGAEVLSSSSVRYAWAPGNQQFTVVYDGRKIGTVTTTSTHVTLQVDPSSIPNSAGLSDSLRGSGEALGQGADIIDALLDGKPVGVAVGPGSALQKALDDAATSAGTSPQGGPTPEQIAKVVDAISQSVKDNVTVTDAGSDQYGDHMVATLPLAKVVDTAWKNASALVPGAAGAKPDLAKLDKVTLQVDVWVKDGIVSRLEIPISKVLKDIAPEAGAGEVTLLVVMSGDGVAPVVGPVTEVPDSLIGSLTGNG